MWHKRIAVLYILTPDDDEFFGRLVVTGLVKRTCRDGTTLAAADGVDAIPELSRPRLVFGSRSPWLAGRGQPVPRSMSHSLSKRVCVPCGPLLRPTDSLASPLLAELGPLTPPASVRQVVESPIERDPAYGCFAMEPGSTVRLEDTTNIERAETILSDGVVSVW